MLKNSLYIKYLALLVLIFSNSLESTKRKREVSLEKANFKKLKTHDFSYSTNKVKEIIKSYIYQNPNTFSFLQDNDFNNDNQIWLYQAFKDKNKKLFQEVLSKSISSENNNSCIQAVLNNDIIALKFFLDNIPNPDCIRDSDGNTLLAISSCKGLSDITSLLIKLGANVNTVNSLNESVLLKAVYGSHKDIVELLLNNNASPNVQNYTSHEQSPLGAAVYLDNIKITKLLLNFEANVNAIDQEGWSILMWASLNSSAELIKLLLDAGADVSYQDALGQNVFMKAALYANKPVVKLLLEHKINLDAIDHEGNNTLTLVLNEETGEIGSEEDCIKMAKLLIKSGIDVDIKNKKNFSALDYAQNNELHDIVDLLRAINLIESDLDKLKDQSLELRDSLVERWINVYKKLPNKKVAEYLKASKKYIVDSKRISINNLLALDEISNISKFRNISVISHAR